MKALTLSLMMFITLMGYSQNPLSLAVYQDARLLVSDDDHGNKAPTLDILFKLKIKLYETEMSYTSVVLDYEHANLFGGRYDRYSLGPTYTLNNLIIKNLEVNAGASYGYIAREHIGGSWSWGLTNEIAYKLTDKFKIAVINQYIERSDIGKNGYSFLAGGEWTF